MRVAVNRLLPCCIGAAILAAPALGAESAGGEPAADRWIPGLGLLGGITAQTHEARVESFESSGAPLRPFDRGSTLAVTPYVGAELQLTSPAIEWLPGGPRLFVRGEFLPSFSPSRDVAKEGDPKGLVFPKPEFFQFAENAVGGVGSRTTTEFGRFAWGAGLGISFPFEFLGRQIRVSSTASWVRYEVELEGLLLAARKDDDNPPPNPNPPPPLALFGGNLREIALFGKDTKTLDGIGPGFEVEMDAARHGPIAVSLVVGGHLYRVLGNRSARISRSVTLTGDGLPDETYTANYSFDPGRWLYRAGVGIRFRFVGN